MVERAAAAVGNATAVATGGMIEHPGGDLYTTRCSTTVLALGDLDGDGNLDLVRGCGSDGIGDGISVPNNLFMGDGAGGFTTSALASAHPEMSTTSIVIGDLNSDGMLDVVVGNYDNCRSGRGGLPTNIMHNELFLNGGGGTLVEQTGSALSASGTQTNALLLIDIDSDGDLSRCRASDPMRASALSDDQRACPHCRDVIVGNQPCRGSPGTQAFRNDGSAAFTEVPASEFPVRGDDAVLLAGGDANNDGRTDIFMISGARAYVVPSDGAGGFGTRVEIAQAEATAIVVGDIDNDGFIDLVLGSASDNRVYLNNGDLTWQFMSDSVVSTGAANTNALALWDMDDDGDRIAAQPQTLVLCRHARVL